MTRLEALKELLADIEAGNPDWCGDQCFDEEHRYDLLEAWRGSLDAAKALHEALLPGWPWRIRSEMDTEYVVVQAPVVCAETDEVIGPAYSHLATDGKIARAWLMAILSALIAQEEAA